MAIKKCLLSAEKIIKKAQGMGKKKFYALVSGSCQTEFMLGRLRL